MTEIEIRAACEKPPPVNIVARRLRLPHGHRQAILAKTAGTCHVCADALSDTWHADHIIPHAHGGKLSIDNLLPICPVCNRLRWSYPPTMFRMIIRLGIIAKQEIRHRTPLGDRLLARLIARHGQNARRRIPRSGRAV